MMPRVCSPPGPHAAHTVTQIHAVLTSRAMHWPMMDREDNRITLRKRYDFDARLHARPLLGEHEFTASKVALGLQEQHRQLQREHPFPVEILVQAVVVPRPVLQQQRCRFYLAGGMTALEECRESWRIVCIRAQTPAPVIRDGCQVRIELSAQIGDERGQRIGEVLVFAPSEAVPPHYDAAAEVLVVRIELSQLLADGRSEEAGQHGASASVQLRGCARPI